MNPIVSSIPGRVRLRDATLRDVARLERLKDTVARWRGVTDVEANARVGSLLVRYDAEQLAPGQVESRIVSASGLGHGAAAKSRSFRRGTPRTRANRIAKRGMLVMLPVSLALAAMGDKRAHILTGNAFLAFLVIHLYVYRHYLLR